jgi:hypothetical protein
VTRFTVVLLARSGRWVAPTLVYLVWVVLVLANPGPARSNAANLFYAAVVLALWLTVSAGNVDDDAHRDLCAAAQGSVPRLQVTRTLAPLAVTCAFVVPVAIVVGVTGDTGSDGALAVTAESVLLLVSGALLGAAVGSFLHRPMVDRPAWSVFGGSAAVILVAVLPPVQRAIRRFDGGSALAGLALAFGTAVVFVAALLISAALADRRN